MILMPKNKTNSYGGESQPKGISKATFAISLAVVAVVMFVLGTRTHNWLSDGSIVNKSLDLSSVQQTYNELSKHYDGRLDTSKLIAGANQGLVKAIDDPYTVYFDKKQAADFSSDLNGTITGIGAELTLRNDKLTVISVVDGSPAKKAGLKQQDVIAKVNNHDTKGWSLDESVSKIRGEAGTTIKLTIMRGKNDTRELDITRAKVTDPSVKAHITKDNIGIMRISRFGDNDTVRSAREAAQNFRDHGVKGVIVDLRGDGGGYLVAARDVASLWLNNKPVVTERTKGKITDRLRSSEGDAILAGVPTVVLVDGGSASASEILAGALKDNGVATLVGEQTFGKGSVQEIIKLSNGAQLKVTVSKWYTPDGKNISKSGIKPDVIVKLTDKEAKAGQDVQQAKALSILRH